MPNEPANIIEFHLNVDSGPPQPCPAAKATPDWLRDMPSEAPGPPGPVLGTVKKCPPFVEAMTCGYVLPILADIRFFMRDAKNLEVHQSYLKSGPIVETHPFAQYKQAPFGGNIVVKFQNGWLVKTPPGYSTLFLPLLNQFRMPFQLLAGLVETDTYYKQVNFPAICTMRPGETFLLKMGTPIVQAIPIKRESWQGNCVQWDMNELERQINAQNENPHFYKDEHWAKKNYR